MSAILVQDLKEESLVQLRARAAMHGKSLQSELQVILETAVTGVDQPALRGQGRTSPVPKEEEAELDSVGKLEQYMSTCWPNAQGWIQPVNDAVAPQKQAKAEPRSGLRSRASERHLVGA